MKLYNMLSLLLMLVVIVVFVLTPAEVTCDMWQRQTQASETQLGGSGVCVCVCQGGDLQVKREVRGSNNLPSPENLKSPKRSQRERERHWWWTQNSFGGSIDSILKTVNLRFSSVGVQWWDHAAFKWAELTLDVSVFVCYNFYCRNELLVELIFDLIHFAAWNNPNPFSAPLEWMCFPT